MLSIYDYYDELLYVDSDTNVLKISGATNTYQIGQCSIKSRTTALLEFHWRTAGIFRDIKWHNFVIAGGFVYSLLNNLTDSLRLGQTLIFSFFMKTKVPSSI